MNTDPTWTPVDGGTYSPGWRGVRAGVVVWDDCDTTAGTDVITIDGPTASDTTGMFVDLRGLMFEIEWAAERGDVGRVRELARLLNIVGNLRAERARAARDHQRLVEAVKRDRLARAMLRALRGGWGRPVAQPRARQLLRPTLSGEPLVARCRSPPGVPVPGRGPQSTTG